MNKRSIILLAFVIGKIAFQYFLISPDYDLQRDEYLHLDQGHHLAWGYLSVPPFTSWVSYIIFLLGGSVFWVKFFPALFGALTLVIVWKAIEELNGNLFALMLGAACIFFSSLLRLNILYQPNSFDVLCWTALYFILIKYISSEKPKWLFAGSLVFAFGFLNKYNIAFLFIGLLPALSLTKNRKIFLKKDFYLAAALALLLIAPNLLWQYNNNFPVVHHMKQLAALQLVNNDRLEFLITQLLFFLGALFVIVAGLYGLLFHKLFKKYRLLSLSIVFTLAAFLYFKAKSYYAIGLYPIYISFGAVMLGELLKDGRRKYWQPVALAVPVIVFIPLYRMGFPNQSPEFIISHPERYETLGKPKWEDGQEHALPQDYADMIGWKELALKVDSVAATLPDLNHTLILADNYGQAGAINYYTTNPMVTASSFNADYINWLPLDEEIKDAILVKEEDDDDPDRTTERLLFDTVYRAAQRINPLAREPKISIYVLRGAKTDIRPRIKEERDRKLKWE